MTWFTKYRLEIADNLGIVWKNDIQVNASVAPGIITLTGSGNPIELELYGDDDPFTQNICGSKLGIEIYSFTDFAFLELFSSSNFEYKSLLYRGSTLFWSGFIFSNNYQEPYNGTPYPVKITATDGLGILSDYQFKDLNYTGRQTMAKIIYDILAVVGISSFAEYISVYDYAMWISVSQSPLDQCGIDTELFTESNNYDVLVEILRIFNAQIRQDDGVVSIFRIVDQAGPVGGTMYGRLFTSATSHTAITKSTDQFLNRTTHASYFKDVDGGTITIIPQLKTLIANQNYGTRDSVLKNWDFKFEVFVVTNTVYTIDGWTPDSGLSIIPLSTQFPKHDGGGVFLDLAETSPPTHAIRQVTESAADSWGILEIEVSGITKDSLSHSGTIYMQIINTGLSGTKYFSNAGYWESGVHTPIIITGVFTPELNFQKYYFDLYYIPYTGTLTVAIFASLNLSLNTFTALKSTKLYYINSANQVFKGIGYTIDVNTYGIKKELEYVLGEGEGLPADLMMHKGVINEYSGTVPCLTRKEWISREDTLNINPLIEQTAGEYGNQFSRPKQLLDISILETDANTFLSMIGNVQDDRNKVDSVNRKFVPCRGNYSIKDRRWDATFVEIITWPSPIIISVIVANASPGTCIITFDQILDNTSIPTANNFVFLPNGASWMAGTVTNVSISGTTVILTLSANVIHGTTYKVIYTPPLTNKLKNIRGIIVVTISDHAVTNNVL